MSHTVKIIELVGLSEQSWEDAVKNVVWEASKSIDGITGVEVLNMTADVRDGKLYDYKVNVQVAFPVKNR
ncbi:MAG: dodecin family protein [Halanaerobiales bacterium]|nr:dodecin family protein [Halanaerobiales bacterium]